MSNEGGEFSSLQENATQNRVVTIDEILAPEANEDELSPEQIAERTIRRLTPFVAPLLTEEEISAGKSADEESNTVRERLAAELIDSLGYLGVFAPGPQAAFDEEAFLAVSGAPDIRPLEVAEQLGLLTRVQGRVTLPERSQELFRSLLT